jgi:hypothetical protein
VDAIAIEMGACELAAAHQDTQVGEGIAMIVVIDTTGMIGPGVMTTSAAGIMWADRME